MKKLFVVLLAVSGCATIPTPQEVKVAVPVPCRIPEPACATPAYDSARNDMPMDLRARLLRAEIAQYEDCLRQYRDALAGCRQVDAGAAEPSVGVR